MVAAMFKVFWFDQTFWVKSRSYIALPTYLYLLTYTCIYIPIYLNLYT